MLDPLFAKLQHWVARTPLIGPLFLCRREDYAAATKEFFIIIAFATATFWLSALFLKVLDSRNALPYIDHFASTFRDGQLFIFAAALLGPVLVFAAEDPPNSRPFPARIWIIFTLVILGIVCSGFYALIRGAGALAPTHTIPLNQDFLRDAAVFCALVAAGARFLAILYNKYRMRPEEVKDSENRFSEAFARRHQSGAGSEGMRR